MAQRDTRVQAAALADYDLCRPGVVGHFSPWWYCGAARTRSASDSLFHTGLCRGRLPSTLAHTVAALYGPPGSISCIVAHGLPFDDPPLSTQHLYWTLEIPRSRPHYWNPRHSLHSPITYIGQLLYRESP